MVPAWLLWPTQRMERIAGIADDDRAPIATGPATEPHAGEWLHSVLREGISPSLDGGQLRVRAEAWHDAAEERRRAGTAGADVELLAAVAALACGDRTAASYHANQSISLSRLAEPGAPTREAELARLVANLARFFAPGGEEAPPGYAQSLEMYARRLDAPGLLRIPAIAQRLAANKEAVEARRYRSEGGGKVFDARSGMTVDIPGYGGK